MSRKTATYSNPGAFDLEASVFVSANAGAGKTSLLTNRVLSLLLHGASPSKILCLTFTNAASAEMANRIQKELGRWVMADDDSLRDALGIFMQDGVTATVMARARSLFAHVLESPEGIRIQTIHGFCQSLLRCFPLEAGISPHFTVMDARTEQELLREARLRLFGRARDEDPRLQEALHVLAHEYGESAFQSLLSEIVQNKRRLLALFGSDDGLVRAIDSVYRALNVPQGSTREKLFARHFSYEGDTLVTLRAVSTELLTSDKATDQKTGQGLAQWLEKPDAHSDGYIDVFITGTGGKRKNLFTKTALTDEKLIECLMGEQERVFTYNEACKALAMAQNTEHILHFAEGLLAIYRAIKTTRDLMDYDDLILTACALLQKPDISPWVLYKLDGGIDHILVDEAQDTSPEQWAIISALTLEFFAGKGRTLADRSLFIVGDEKQSIYSFQGADPAALGKMQAYFASQINAAGKPLHRVELQASFRSAVEILSAVDAIFAIPAAREGLTFGSGELKHIATRLAYPGLVELWPVTEPLESDDGFTVSSATLLARRIAETIRSWFDSGVMLEARGRPVRAGDIMILVRSRTKLVDRLVRALKKHGVPVAGQDRMALSDNLAVQDLTALGQCVLLPEDDLSLAALLKSPIFGLSEEDLFALAWNRNKETLWKRLSTRRTEDAYTKAFTLLSDLRARADYVSPFELYSYLLDTLGARKRITGRMGEEYNDPIDEFLGQALLYERSHVPSLQGFLHWLNASDSEIKRDMEQAQDSVRIMTIHGAKGLQAPIVILPDTIEKPVPRHALHWHHDNDRTIPLWNGSAAEDTALSASVRYRQKQEMMGEYRRLLYVALTRAEDRLYICGATAKETVSDDCWYQLVKDGITPIASPFETAWGEGLRIGQQPTRGAVYEEKTPVLCEPQVGTFEFLSRPAPQEPLVAQPLVPSRLVGGEPAAASPLGNAHGYQRGKLIHRLLQYMPDVAVSQRAAAAATLATGAKQTMPASEIESCIAEAFAVMNDPRCAFLFEPGALAEVPVAGCVLVDEKTVAVSGQIDRLCVRSDEIWIADFKSGRAAPTAEEKIPVAYLRQMRLYSLLLKEIYPTKTIKCALVWTHAPMITVIAESLLDETAITTYI